ncbi:hypothetical protein RB595_005830 [Gaeumannomyces hyphopodioides]
MPADFPSAAAAALSTSPERRSSVDPASNPQPPWAQRPPRSSRRHSRTVQSKQPFSTTVIRAVSSLSRQLWTVFLRLPRIQQAAIVVAAISLPIFSILFLLYSHAIFTWLGPVAKAWRGLPGGWLIIWAMAFASAFPPMIGYSTSMTLAGMVYGFPLGWPIAASATVAGSTAAFMTSRGIFSGYVQSLVGTDKRFVALSQVLRRDGLLVLTGVRFCPLPYSLSNGFLSTIPSIRPWSFALATAFVSPKLLIHVFIGSRLAKLAEEGDTMAFGDKMVNYTGMGLSAVVGGVVGLVVYRRTMARAAELACEERQQQGLPFDEDDEGGYEDSDAGSGRGRGRDGEQSGLMSVLMNPDDAEAAALMDDDDISLWGADDYELDRGPSADRRFADEEAALEGDGARASRRSQK